MTIRIDGLPPEESDALLAALFDHSERPEFVYRHKWRVGDLVVWDNRCSMHARDDFPSDQRRLMFRTTVKGSGGRTEARRSAVLAQLAPAAPRHVRRLTAGSAVRRLLP